MKSEGKKSSHFIPTCLMWVVLLASSAIFVMRFLAAGVGDSHGVPELVAFVPWTIIPFGIVFVIAMVCRRRIAMILAGVGLVFLFAAYAGYLMPTTTLSTEAQTTADTGVSTSDNVVRIMTLNVSNAGADPVEVVQAVVANNVEVLCLQEVTNDYIAQLEAAGIANYLPYQVVSEVGYVNNGGRNCIFSAAATSNESSDLLPVITSSMAACTIEVGGVALRFVSVHINSPHLGGESWWAEGLSAVAELANYDHTYVICGDFNATWDHTRFRELLGSTFVDAGEQAGEGLHFTYPANSIVPAVLEIDHIVYSQGAGIVVGDLTTLEISGTDHMALLATLEVQA